jgi:hypothetical protein
MAERQVLYRGPAKGGFQHQGKVYYPGDIIPLNHEEIGASMRSGGHVFQWTDGDIVRPYELTSVRAGVAVPVQSYGPPEDESREKRLAAAQLRAHTGDTAGLDAMTENAALAHGTVKAKDVADHTIPDAPSAKKP